MIWWYKHKKERWTAQLEASKEDNFFLIKYPKQYLWCTNEKGLKHKYHNCIYICGPNYDSWFLIQRQNYDKGGILMFSCKEWSRRRHTQLSIKNSIRTTFNSLSFILIGLKSFQPIIFMTSVNLFNGMPL